MKRQTSLCCLLLCLGLPLAAQGAEATGSKSLAELAARLDQSRIIQADFTQTKTLQALKRPIKTTGRLVFSRNQGVLWRIEKPYQASYLLGPDSVTEIAADGSRRVRPTRDAPALAQMGKVFQAIFQGNIQALEAHFDVHSESNAAGFRVAMTPKPSLARFLRGITAKGSEFLDSIEIEEAGGDHTRILFSGTRLDAPLSASDRDLFRD